MGLYVRQMKLGPMDNFVYLVGAEGARETATVEGREGASPVRIRRLCEEASGAT